ncbi:MAG: S8 family serine peptidase, partial [Myxococcota bacterium]|nr:S8 family serine peptidase [Myxococcota bacterium]
DLAPDQSLSPQLLDTLNVLPWHELGYKGSGVKIAVFDIEWFGAEISANVTAENTHDCFAHQSCAPRIDPTNIRFENEQGRHGIACAEVVQKIAPEAELHLVRVGNRTTLENAVEWAIREDIDIISMSLSFFNESFYDGTGPNSDQIFKLHNADILMVTSAGNYARQHVRDPFYDPDWNGWHNFDHGTEYMPIYYSEGSHRMNILWDEFERCGTTDLDAYVWSPSGELVGRGFSEHEIGSNRCHPGERFQVTTTESGWHYLQLYRHRGGSVDIDIMARGGTVYFKEPTASIVDPGNHPYAFTVGAANINDYFDGSTEPFSSHGAPGMFKPDIVGPDSLSTHTYGGWGFYGTSASTPAVAGMIAVIMSRYPEKSPYWASDFLKRSAVNPVLSQDGHSNEMGAGYARLPSTDRGCGGNALFLLPLLGIFRRKAMPKPSRIGYSNS